MTLLGMMDRGAATTAVREAASRLGLDLAKPADAQAAVAYVTVIQAGPRVFAALTGGTVDREIAAEAAMQAERSRPGLLAAALDGAPQAVRTLQDAVASAGSALETRDDEERALVQEMRAMGKSERQILMALENYREHKRAIATGLPRDGRKGPPSFIPDDVLDKIPKQWAGGRPNNDTGEDGSKPGWRWESPWNNGDGVRIDRGNPTSGFASQRVDHVIVRSRGVVLGRDGKPINGSVQDDAENAHIPLSEYRNWRLWNKP